jgi:hypothetical protein
VSEKCPSRSETVSRLKELSGKELNNTFAPGIVLLEEASFKIPFTLKVWECNLPNTKTSNPKAVTIPLMLFKFEKVLLEIGVNG